jgi:putative ABC transport system permease protein
VVAGQTGLLAGVALIEVARRLPNDSPLGAPHVDAALVAVASVLMALAGVVAGLLPATRAAAISPIEALRGR